MRDKLYLIGFMGSGKSCTGTKIAERLGYEWVDLDAAIVKQQGCSIKEIFETRGEAYFRSLENQILEDSISKRKQIVSTGGGIVVAPNNRLILKQQPTLYLQWDFETLFKRIVEDEERPLVQSYPQLLELYRLREPLYRESAVYTIRGEGLKKKVLVEEIIKWMEM